MPSYKRFPTDSEFSREIQSRNMYTTRPAYWTRRLENYDRKEPVPTNEYTIEHIMPQNENLSKEWQMELGPDWKRVHEEYLNHIGNLTLTGYNSEYKDKPFSVKQTIKGGFKESPLRLNAGLGQEKKWDEEAIRKRGGKLADLALKAWPNHGANLEMKRTQFPKASTYSINDHPFLQNKPTSELFEALRAAVLALDPVVNEEFLKLYVAYKAETNFVDVIPLAKSLHLTLNIGYNDLNDPKGMCKDISEISHWGNGDVDLYFSKMEELPYVMDLIRQSLQSQIGGE